MQDVQLKDTEVERTKVEMQALHEKLSQLSEYDRTLKFELRLYRGVLESEYRRKTQQPVSMTTLVQATMATGDRWIAGEQRNTAE